MTTDFDFAPYQKPIEELSLEEFRTLHSQLQAHLDLIEDKAALPTGDMENVYLLKKRLEELEIFTRSAAHYNLSSFEELIAERDQLKAQLAAKVASNRQIEEKIGISSKAQFAAQLEWLLAHRAQLADWVIFRPDMYQPLVIIEEDYYHAVKPTPILPETPSVTLTLVDYDSRLILSQFGGQAEISLLTVGKKKDKFNRFGLSGNQIRRLRDHLNLLLGE